LPTARILLLVNYRHEYQHTWGHKTYYTRFRIDPLPEESASVLLRALLGPDPGLDPLRRLLLERTEGNPFILEESVRALVETGAFLYETRLFPDAEYTFKHALTHEVTYGSLLQDRRRALHTSIVDAIERLNAERLGEHVELLAHHALRGEAW